MKKLATIGVLATGVFVLPAQAKPPHPTHPAHPNSCAVHNVGYKAGGTLVSQNLGQSQGALTATKKDDRYSGNDVVVDVKKANHHAPKGVQTFSLTNAKAGFHVPDRNSDGKRNELDLRANDRVTLHGKITRVHRGCSGTPTITVNRVDFNKPKPAHPAHPARP
jgi:hypothetical protein